jgi:hypothetical protein
MMRTMLTIGGIVLGIASVLAAAVVGLAVVIGPWPAVGVSAAVALLAVGAYVRWLGPWQRRWGATDAEVARTMPGDDLFPDAAATTRVITIDAPPEAVWPWLVQIGHGRAGWYSYDWIDNDGRPSLDRIVPELQDLGVGSRILMTPGMGPVVREVREGCSILSAGEADSWCVALYPTGSGTRLVSRWRAAWPGSVATWFWIAVSDPGSFVMERKMLKGIKARAERPETASRKPEAAPA